MASQKQRRPSGRFHFSARNLRQRERGRHCRDLGQPVEQRARDVPTDSRAGSPRIIYR